MSDIYNYAHAIIFITNFIRKELKLMKKGVISLLSVLLLLLVGCSSQTENSESENQLKVATNAEFPPFVFKNPDGSIDGFDVEVLQAIAKASGFEASIDHLSFDGIFDGIDRGKYKVGIGGITIRDDRDNYDFTEPYFDAKQLILVPVNSQVNTLKDLNGKKIGVQQSTTGEMVVQNAFGKTYEHLKGYDDLPTAIDDLKLGRLDAVVADNQVVAEFSKKLGADQFKVVEDPSIPVEQYGFVVKKGDQEMLNKLNEGIKKIQEDGTYQKIYEKYFGVAK